MCTEAELDEAYEHYLEIHFPHRAAIDVLLDDQELARDRSDDPEFRELGTDLGVKDMLQKSVAELVYLTGLPEGSTAFPFAEPGTPGDLDGDVQPGGKPAIKPEWHQWVGVACLVRAWYTAELGQRPSAMMLCDEVGLGKTLQMIGSISLLVHYLENQRRGLDLPPVVKG
jgi:SNF2 family DNA or RNA helicase